MAESRPGLWPIPRLDQALGEGEITAIDLVNDCLTRIDEWNEKLNAFLFVDRQGALQAARESVDRRRAGKSLGPLDGIPFALKDNIVARGMPATCGSRILENFISPYDATLTARLKAAGAILLGKLNLDEFAMGSSNEHSAFGPARNPHDFARVPGGSSGGSCVAVASGMAPLAFGSETGGSVRLPASFCGVVGLKPSYGRISRSGLVAFGSSLDQIGPVARTVSGVALALRTVAGLDPEDATSHPAPVPDYFAALAGKLPRMKVGVVKEFLGEGVDPHVRRTLENALRTMESFGCELQEVSLPHAEYGVSAYYVVASAEASSNLARFDGVRYGHRANDVTTLEELYTKSRSEGFGDEVKRRIMIGTFALSSGYYDAYYGRAMRARGLIARDFAQAFSKVDVLVSPVSPTPAFPLGDRMEDPLAMYLSDAMTIPANLAGVPAISVPCPVAEGELPVGLHLQAPFLQEERLLRVAAAFEHAAGAAEFPKPLAHAGETR
ncbi:MAG TPA: Asp-tRNA(Asn)/Glu-tRNA(Gln) amidotransferase subunit GatA [bacterium]|nr:Asp-tRNA(Asn)/Glu-tRNA(Gln) amidotransferase subunit GatA [bacterium]